MTRVSMHQRQWLLLATMLVGCGPKELRVTMNSDNNSGQTGFAVLVDRGERGMTVTVETSAPDVVGAQNAHIHEGNCGEVGIIRAPLQPIALLADKAGRVGSTTQVEGLTFKDFKTGEWIINLHDVRNNSVYVSCGEIPVP